MIVSFYPVLVSFYPVCQCMMVSFYLVCQCYGYTVQKYITLFFVVCSQSIDVSKIEEDSVKQETEALKSQLETVERLNDTLRSALVLVRCL